jgi:hypothetical protein
VCWFVLVARCVSFVAGQSQAHWFGLACCICPFRASGA